MRLRKLRVLLLSVCIVLLAGGAALEHLRCSGSEGGRCRGGLLYPPTGYMFRDCLTSAVSLSSDSDHLYFDFQFAALTNPFQAPEGYFTAPRSIRTHGTALAHEVEWQLNLQTAPELGWDLRLSVPLRRDQALRRWRRKPGAGFSEGVTSYSRLKTEHSCKSARFTAPARLSLGLLCPDWFFRRLSRRLLA